MKKNNKTRIKKFLYAPVWNWEKVEKMFEKKGQEGYELKKIVGCFAYFEKSENVQRRRYVFINLDYRRNSGDMGHLSGMLRKYAGEIETRFFPYFLYQTPIEQDEQTFEIKKRREKDITIYLRTIFLSFFILALLTIPLIFLFGKPSSLEICIYSAIYFITIFNGFHLCSHIYKVKSGAKRDERE